MRDGSYEKLSCELNLLRLLMRGRADVYPDIDLASIVPEHRSRYGAILYFRTEQDLFAALPELVKWRNAQDPKFLDHRAERCTLMRIESKAVHIWWTEGPTV